MSSVLTLLIPSPSCRMYRTWSKGTLIYVWKEVEKGMAGVGGGKENSREKVVHCSEGAPYW